MSKIKFLFINPINGNRPDETCFPSLGLGYLASAVKTAGLPVDFEIFNCNMEANVLHKIRYYRPDIVGITSVSQYYNKAMSFARLAKSFGLPVIIGGTHISALPETITAYMDIAVLGEGEQTIVELIKLYLSEGSFFKNGMLRTEELDKINGIAFRYDSKLVVTKLRDMIQPLDMIQPPDRSILYIGKSTSMFTSRGCPYRCTYCYSSRYWDKVRFFSAEYVVSEIEQLYTKFHVKSISLLDDLFIADKKRLAEIVNKLAKKNLLGKIDFICNVRSNLVTEELVNMLHAMRVKIVGMGIESGCQKTLEYLKGKGNITVQDHARAMTLLRKVGIAPHPSFIIGSPCETKEDALETIKFIEDNRIKDFEIYVLVPFPGTPVWDYALSRRLVSNNMDWDRLYWDFGKNSNPVILSEQMSRKEILEIYCKLISRRNKYIALRHPLLATKYVLGRCLNGN
jgi:anaerobic magnesium-protoporphyrin IX monomethyl ester cyclase